MNLGKVGIIFTGGGFTGSFSVGVFEALWKAGIRPAHVQGISVGTLNAAEVVETWSAEKLKKLWLDIERARAPSVFNWKDIPINVLKKSNALFSNKGLLDIVKRIDVHKIIQSPVELQIVTCNESAGKVLTTFSSHDPQFKENPELLRSVILASASIPGILPPVTIKGEVHSDGICFCLEPMIQTGCDTIFLILNDQLTNEHGRWDERLFNMKHFLYEEVVSYKIKEFLKEYPDFELVNDDDSSSPNPFLPPIVKKIKVIGQQIRSMASSVVHGNDINFVPRRLVVVNPRTPISTLHVTGFEIGDIKAFIEQGCDQGSVILKKL